MERLLVAASMILTTVIAWSVWDAYQQEWTEHQATYYRMAAQRAPNPAQAEWAREQRREIKQLEPRERGTVERCVTCHLAVDNPGFGDVAEPLRRHPAILERHPPRRFGCVVCHGGEGRAVAALAAHGQGGVLAKPLLKGAYMQAACFTCHGEDTLPPSAIAAVTRGRQLMNRYLCLGCHQIDGEGGQEGPELSTVGSQRNWLWLYAHLTRPQGVIIGSTMPVYPFSRNEIRDITVYLMTLLDVRDRMRVAALRARRVVTASELPTPPKGTPGRAVAGGEAETNGVPYDGRALFRGAGCRLCHTVGIQGGEVAPALTYIGHRRSPHDLERVLRDPEQVFPGGKMPQLHLNERQIKALAGYLGTLR